MKYRQWAVWGVCFLLLAACGRPGQDGEGATGDEQAPADEAAQTPADETTGAAEKPMDGATGRENPAGGGEADARSEVSTGIVPGLTMRVLEAGRGETAASGQTAVVHYTGWLYDPEAADHRGKKFDSSVDRGQPFEFPLGAGAVIEGWDNGVVGMQIGEVRELTIAPELAYGERGAGTVIPPGATLVFEVELIDLVGGEAATT